MTRPDHLLPYFDGSRELRMLPPERTALRAVAEARAAEGDALPPLAGHAAIFDVWTVIGPASAPWWMERFARGAFRESIAADDIRALWNHEDHLVLGRNRAGTLQLREDDVGLAVTIQPPRTQVGRDAVTLIERGDVSQMSIGFDSQAEVWEYREDGIPQRTITTAKLWEVSPITFPAYLTTDIAVRSARAVLDAARRDGRLPALAGADPLDLARRRLQLAELDA